LLHDKVSEHLSKLWQPHAGWCQQVLFFADLKPSSTTTSPVKKESITYSKIEIEEEETIEEGGETEKKKSFEEEVREIMENPGRKRRRVTVIKTEEKVEIKQEQVVIEAGEEEGRSIEPKIKKRGKQKIKLEV
jgi:N-glycosylase/DNA lyase